MTLPSLSGALLERTSRDKSRSASAECCPGLCAVCRTKNGTLIPCTACQSVYYCSTRHMDLHRFQHKVVCSELLKKRRQLEEEYSANSGRAQWEFAGDGPSPPLRSCTRQRTVPSAYHRPLTTSEGPRPACSHWMSRKGALSSPQNTNSSSKFLAETEDVISQSSSPAALPEIPADPVAEVGRASWKVLHAVSLGYPSHPTTEEQNAARQFLNSFSVLFPCEKCRLHFTTLLRMYPPDVDCRSSFVKWMSFFHNQVNVMLGKNVYTTTSMP
jgi:hypothetical protein